MNDEDVKKVVEIIKENPLDDFWAAEGNADLFYEIVDMVKEAGYDLVLKKK